MKNENNDNRLLSEIVSEIKHTIQIDESNRKLIQELDKKVADITTFHKNLSSVFIIIGAILVATLGGVFLVLDRNDALNARIASMEYHDSLYYVFMEPDSDNTISYREKNGKPITYHQLEAENDSLGLYKMLWELTTKNYPISYKKEDNTYTIIASKIDSAMLLLPLYRDMIKYNPRTNTWTSTRYR